MQKFKQYEDINVSWEKATKKEYKSHIMLVPSECNIQTLEGIMKARRGDFVVKDVELNQFVIKKENMEYNYRNLIATDKVFNIHSGNLMIPPLPSFYIGDRIPTEVEFVQMEDAFSIENEKDDVMVGLANDYIVRLPNGFIYRIEESIFKQTYDY